MSTQTEPRDWSQEIAYQPVLRDDVSPSLWAQIFSAHEDRRNLRTLPGRAADLACRAFPAICREACFHAGRLHPPQNDPDVVRAFMMSGGDATAAFKGLLNQFTLEGFAEVENSLADIMAVDELTNYLPAPIVQSLDMHSLAPLPRGGTATLSPLSVVDFGMIQLVRFARSALIDEQDLVNDIPGSLRNNLSAIGRAAKRCVLDLAWATILTNPAIDQDGKNLFCEDHGNLGNGAGSALSDTSIGAAMAAIRRQVVLAPDAGGATQVQHVNILPRVVIIPPELETAARKALRLMKLDDPDIDLQLRVESRMTDLGVRNPITGDLVRGTATNWLVTSDKTVAPWLVQGLFQGQQLPVLHSYMLDGRTPSDLDRYAEAFRSRPAELGQGSNRLGQWGLAIDVQFSCAVKAVDFRGCYFSAGV